MAYPGAKPNLTTRSWIFPSGATIRFNHVEHEKDARAYDGHEFNVVEFDELTHFTAQMYRAVRARIRSSVKDLPTISRATTNPGGEGAEWVFERFGPWLDPEFVLPERAPRLAEDGGTLPPAEPGEILWYLPSEEGEVWCAPGTQGALTRQFIPASLADNPYLGPEYRAQLMDLDPVRRAQLLRGDWLIKPGAGAYFKREWFQFVDAAPDEAARIRYWDRAATTDGDWTVGLLLARSKDGICFVEDVIRFRGTPRVVQDKILETAKLDAKKYRGRVMIGIEKDPGQAGKFEADYYVALLAKFNVRTFGVSKDKVTRAQPVSAQTEARRVKLVRGQWNERFIQELEGFPDWQHDDQVDSLSGAYAALVGGPRRRTTFDVADARRIFPFG
jgi:predicted phage terminase large subunit-like protein